MGANLATPLSVQCVRATQSAPRGATSAAATTPDGVLRDCGWILTFELHGIIATERRAVMEALNLVPSKPTSTTVNFCNTSQTPYTFVHAGHTLCISIAAGVDALPVQAPAQLAFRPRGARMFRARLGAGTGVITVEADCVVEQDRAAPMFPLRGENGERVCSRSGDHFRVTVQLDGRWVPQAVEVSTPDLYIWNADLSASMAADTMPLVMMAARRACLFFCGTSA